MNNENGKKVYKSREDKYECGIMRKYRRGVNWYA